MLRPICWENKKTISSYRLLKRFPSKISIGNTFIVLCWGLTTCQPLWVILCRLPEKGRKEIEEEMKERNREERGTGMKGKKQKK